MKSPMSVFRFLSIESRESAIRMIQAQRKSQSMKPQKTYIRPNRPTDTRARKC